MDWLRIDNADVGTLCLALLATVAVAYLLSVPGKSRGTAWLTATTAGLALHLVAALLLAVVNVGRAGVAGALFNLDTLLLAASGVAALGFAFAFLADRPSAVARPILIAAFSALGVLAALTAIVPRVSPRAIATGAYALAGLAYLASAATLLARSQVSGVLCASHRERQGVRSFGALMALGVVVAGLGYASAFHGASDVFAWMVLLAFLVGLVALYVSYAPEPTSLQAKVVAFVLAAALTTLAGAVALGNRSEDLARSSGVAAPEQYAVRLVPTRDGGYRTEPTATTISGLGGEPVPASFFWTGLPVDLGFAFPFGGRTWRTLRVHPSGYVSFGAPDSLGVATDAGAPIIAPLYAPPSAENWEVERAYVLRESGRLVVTWLAVTSGLAKESATYHLALDESGVITLGYGAAEFVRSLARAVLPQGNAGAPLRLTTPGPLPPSIPPGGVLQTAPPAYDAHTSRRLLPWVWLAVGLTGAVLVGLPILLRTSVTRPLDRLLDGVRRVEEGDLTTEVAVEAPDEVGRLTGHFNQMTASLRQANEDLQAYAETLEDRVEERTAELADRNADLASEKAALARTLDELRRAQSLLVQQEKLVALGRLTSGIAHEIKNPLNFVVNFADLSRELLDDLLADAASAPDTRLADVQEDLSDLRANAGRVSEHGRRADAIVRAMMDHAQGGAETVQPVEVNALVEEHVRLAVEGWRAGGDRPAFEVAREYDADVGAHPVTPRGLGRVVVNLVSNALDAVGEQGEPPANGAVTVRTRRTDGAVEIVVEDRGVGVASDALPKLFEPFYTTKPTGQGNVGLGLSLSRDVVVSHGGRLEVESVESEGSTFTVVLPTG